MTDIDQFKEKQKIWDKLAALGKTEINSQISIETNVFQNITVQIKAHLTKPSILDEDFIEFDTTQIGSNTSRSIKIVNPSEQPIYVSLFLSFEPLSSAVDFELSPKS